jgi:hypothetical protein
MNPRKFLYRLGIENRSHAEGHNCPALHNETLPPSEDLKFDSMAPSYMDALFKGEQLARETLGQNFKRLQNSMRRLRNAPVFGSGPLSRVAELGGGAGVLGMWIVGCGLARDCEIYDHAANPLAVGKQWAEKLGLATVSFHEISYAQIASTLQNKNCDFVFAEHAVQLNNYPNIWDESDHEIHECHAFFSRRYHELAAAISALLKPGCGAFIGYGVATPWALELLCEALRSHNLAIDWSLTTNRDGLQLYVHDKVSPILNSAREEAQALVCDMIEIRSLRPPEIPSQRAIFADGNSYLELRFHAGEVRGEILVKQKAGLVFFIEHGSEVHESAELGSARHIVRLVKQGLDVVTRTEGCIVTHRFVDPRIEAIFKSYEGQ